MSLLARTLATACPNRSWNSMAARASSAALTGSVWVAATAVRPAQGSGIIGVGVGVGVGAAAARPAAIAWPAATPPGLLPPQEEAVSRASSGLRLGVARLCPAVRPRHACRARGEAGYDSSIPIGPKRLALKQKSRVPRPIRGLDPFRAGGLQIRRCTRRPIRASAAPLRFSTGPPPQVTHKHAAKS